MLLDHCDVIVDVRSGRDPIEELGEESHAADELELVVTAEHVGDRDGVDGLVGVEQPGDGLEDGLVSRFVEVLGVEGLEGNAGGVRREEHCSQHGLFGFLIVRRHLGGSPCALDL